MPEGLPLAVTLALAFSVRRMLADHNLVRACLQPVVLTSSHLLAQQSVQASVFQAAARWQAGAFMRGTRATGPLAPRPADSSAAFIPGPSQSSPSHSSPIHSWPLLPHRCAT